MVDRRDEEFSLIINSYKHKKGVLIPLLQATQGIYGYLSKEAMKTIADSLRIPFSEVYGVATFYAQFRFKPRGKYLIKVCSGTACHVRGGSSILEDVENILGINNGETTEDMRFSIETVACLGACGLAPVVMINEESYGRLTTGDIKKIIEQLV